MGESPNEHGGVRFEIVELSGQGAKTTKAKVKFFQRLEGQTPVWGRARTANLAAGMVSLQVGGSYFGELSWYPPSQPGYHPSLCINFLWLRTREGWKAVPNIKGDTSTKDPKDRTPKPVDDDFPKNADPTHVSHAMPASAGSNSSPNVPLAIKEAALKEYIWKSLALVEEALGDKTVRPEEFLALLETARGAMGFNGFFQAYVEEAQKTDKKESGEIEKTEPHDPNAAMDAEGADQAIPF